MNRKNILNFVNEFLKHKQVYTISEDALDEVCCLMNENHKVAAIQCLRERVGVDTWNLIPYLNGNSMSEFLGARDLEEYKETRFLGLKDAKDVVDWIDAMRER